MRLRRHRPTPTVPRPRLEVPTDTGGKQARERAEAALDDAKRRREIVQGLRSFLDYQAAQNHFTQDILTTFRGGRQ